MGSISREITSTKACEEVVEFPLLLPEWQARALESLAYARGVTTAEMVRRLLGEFLNRSHLR